MCNFITLKQLCWYIFIQAYKLLTYITDFIVMFLADNNLPVFTVRHAAFSFLLYGAAIPLLIPWRYQQWQHDWL